MTEVEELLVGALLDDPAAGAAGSRGAVASDPVVSRLVSLLAGMAAHFPSGRRGVG